MDEQDQLEGKRGGLRGAVDVDERSRRRKENTEPRLSLSSATNVHNLGPLCAKRAGISWLSETKRRVPCPNVGKKFIQAVLASDSGQISGTEFPT